MRVRANMDKHKINVDRRYIELNAIQAVRDIFDALVEIITNCDDSYHRLSQKDSRYKNGGDILVEITRRRRSSQIVIKDKAEGMNNEDMMTKLGNMGKRTGGEGSRGFMARGLRDCLALGNIKVESKVNGKYYGCQLWQEDHTIEQLGQKSINTELFTTKHNGTQITLDYNSSVAFPQFDNLVRLLSQHYALRDIIKNRKIIIKDTSGKTEKLKPISYVGELVLNMDLDIDKYPDAQAHLYIYKSSKLLKYEDKRFRQSGILIVGGRAIHQCTLLKYDNDDIANYYYGRLECDYIQTLLEEYDNTPKSERPASNPIFLIDPNRQGGLSATHPFTKALFAKVGKQIKLLIDKDRQDKESNKGDISDQDIRKRLDKLATEANKFLKNNVDDEEITPAEENALDGVQKKGLYILPPKFKVEKNQSRSLTIYVRRDLYDSNRKTKVQTTDAKIIELAKTFTNRKLKPHPHNESIFYGSFTVRGVACGEATVIVRPSKDTEIETVGTVVKKQVIDEPYLQNDIEFERKKYTIIEGKPKKIKIFAKPFVIKKGDVVFVTSPDEGVVIKIGRQCTLTPHTNGSYAEGEIEVVGRSITERAIKIVARLKDKGLEASTNIRVIERQGVENGFQFDLVNKNLGELRARWADLDDKPNLLEISAVHPSLKKYFGEPPEFPQQKESVCRALLAEIITESICLRILRREIRSRPGSFQFDGKEPNEVLDEISINIQKKVNQFIVKAHQILSD